MYTALDTLSHRSMLMCLSSKIYTKKFDMPNFEAVALSIALNNKYGRNIAEKASICSMYELISFS